MPSPIAIIGGGPCGLTFANLLERRNIDYVVYERDASATPTPRFQGGTLDIHGSTGQLALKNAGLFDDFNKLARWDATGVHIVDKTFATKVKFAEGRDAPEIDRFQLRRLLLDSIPPEKIRWDHAVRAIERGAGHGWVIKFADGSTASGFRLVVGADGAWSKVRSLLTSTKPAYSGKTFIEARISRTNPCYNSASAMAGKGNFIALGNNKWISVQQMADESYRVYHGLKVPEDLASNLDFSSTESIRSWLVSSPECYVDWAPELKDIVANAEGPYRPWALYSMPAEAMGWVRVPGVVLLGDAAHITVPDGEGVNTAMYDALLLSDRISEYGGGDNDDGLENAVAAYEEDMFLRASDRIAESKAMLNMLFADDSPKQFVDMIEAHTAG